MAEPSFRVSPEASVLAARSDPARSTRLISDVFVVSCGRYPNTRRVYMCEGGEGWMWVRGEARKRQRQGDRETERERGRERVGESVCECVCVRERENEPRGMEGSVLGSQNSYAIFQVPP